MRQLQGGASFVELLAVMGLAAIALGLGIPAFSTAAANARMTSAVNDVVASLQAARAAAITRRSVVAICAAPGGEPPCSASASLATGWLVFVDTDGSGSVTGSEAILQRKAGLAPTLVDYFTAADSTGNPSSYIAFNAAGQILPDDIAPTPSAVDLQLCDARGDVTVGSGLAAGRWVHVAPVGYVQLMARRVDIQAGPLGGC